MKNTTPTKTELLQHIQELQDMLAERREHVAYLRYGKRPDGVTTVHLCDSDADGAFKVYRHPLGAK